MNIQANKNFSKNHFELFGIDVDFDKLNELKVEKHSIPKHESYPFPRREGAGLIIKPLQKD